MILYLLKDYCPFRGMCHFNGTFLFRGYDFRNCGSSFFKSAIFFKTRVLLPFFSLFRGIKSFEPKGLPRFRRVIDGSLAAIIAGFPIAILILAGMFAAGIGIGYFSCICKCIRKLAGNLLKMSDSLYFIVTLSSARVEMRHG